MRCCAALALFLLGPLFMILVKSVQDKDGAFVGLLQFREYLATPRLRQSIWNTLWVALVVTGDHDTAGVHLRLRADALVHARQGAVPRHRADADPRAVAAVGDLVHPVVRQPGGAERRCSAAIPVYGPLGIVISSIYATFPHALMIVLTALLLSDGRLYEAAESLGTRTWRRFFTITLPGAKYGLVSAAMVVFSYTVSDFGIPKVIGGNFNVLAVDIYKQVIGQQNFNKGAVVSLVLLVPVLVAFIVDWIMQGRQQAQFSARAVPYAPKPAPWFDGAMFALLPRSSRCCCWRCSAWRSTRRSSSSGPTTCRSASATTRSASSTAASSTRSSTASRWRLLAAFFGTTVHLRLRVPAGEDARHAGNARADPPAGGDPDGRAGDGARARATSCSSTIPTIRSTFSTTR